MRCLIIYSTTSGNTEIVISEVASIFSAHSWRIDTLRAEQTGNCDISSYDFVILACGTYGHGLLQERMNVWVEKFGRKIDFSHTKCAAIGL